jgi:DNA polymerase-4
MRQEEGQLHEATILHVDMDAFFASVTERDHPELKGKAVVIGVGVRGVVTSASYEARKFGIKAAMPVSRAQRLAPHAIFIPPDHKRYSEVSEHIMEIFHSFTPLVEPISLDEAFLDVTKARRLLGDGRKIAAAIRAKVELQEGITCSVGIASSKFIAKLASQRCKPNGILQIPTDRVLTFLHPLPVSALWGVGPKTNEVLERLGLHTVGDIAQTPRATLIRVLGQGAGESLYELAWGRDDRDVIPEEPDKSISSAETFDRDIDDPEIITKEILRMCERASSRMRERSLFAKTISLKIRFADFTTINRSKTVALPIDTTHEIFEIAKALYEGLSIHRARIRLVGISLENLHTETHEQLLLGGREASWREVQGGIDAAKARFGRDSVRPGSLVDGSESDSE